MTCEKEEDEYDDAVGALDIADVALESSRRNLAAAESRYRAAIAAMVACYVTLELPTAFVACEVVAYLNAKSSEEALEAARADVSAKQKASDLARRKAERSQRALNSCLRPTCWLCGPCKNLSKNVDACKGPGILCQAGTVYLTYGEALDCISTGAAMCRGTVKEIDWDSAMA